MDRVLAIIVVVMISVAGCNALGPGQTSNTTTSSVSESTVISPSETAVDSPSSTPTEETQTEPPTTTVSESATAATTSAMLTTTAGVQTPSPIDTDTETATTAPSEELPPANDLKADVLAAIDTVESYRVHRNRTIRRSGGIERTTILTSNRSFNRTTRELRVNLTQSSAGRTIAVERYLMNQTLYVHSQQYVRQYDSTWVKQNLSESYDAVWNASDVLARQRALLNISTVTVQGTETVAGVETYVLRAELPSEQLEDLTTNITQQGEYDINESTAMFWISTDSMLPVRSTINSSGQTSVRGRTIDFTQTTSVQYSGYGSRVTIQLPPAADSAVPLGLGTTSTETAATGDASSSANETPLAGTSTEKTVTERRSANDTTATMTG